MTTHRPLKITVVGDGMVGKTCLLITYVNSEFPKNYIPTVFDNHAVNITVDSNQYYLTLWDTAGQEDYERLRPFCYPNTSCFLLCYAIDSRPSFENVKSKWWPEIQNFSSKIPVVLVGTKLDLRIPNSPKFVTLAEATKLKKLIKAHSIVECSAKNQINLGEVFDQAVRAVIKCEKQKTKECRLL